jgi:acetylornithine/succinyldiaminopimelate/putrescine aminotransferase
VSDDGLLKTYKTLPITIERGQGSVVWDAQGARYLDMYAGHAVTATGHAHPTVVSAICDQAKKLIFYSNVMDLEVRRRAARALIAHCPPPLSHALFINSGAEAIENAVKLAVLQTGRKKVIAMNGAFHGRTLLALNLTHSPKYRPTIPYVVTDIEFIPFGDLETARKAVTKDVAAVILEPIQSMAGVVTTNEAYFKGLADACRSVGAFLIYDEIQTGFGRTGTMFFSGRYGVVPDVMCLAKAIGSGIPLGAIVVRKEHADKVEYGQFGATFGGGPVAMAALEATLRVFDQERLLENVIRQGEKLMAGLKPHCQEVRGMGLFIGVRGHKPAADLHKALLQKRILTGTSDDPAILRLLPPLVLKDSEVEEFLSAFKEIAR